MRTRTLVLCLLFLIPTGIPSLVRAEAPATLQVGFGAQVITPVGPSPPGWGFTPQPLTGVWGEEFVDANDNGCYDIDDAEPPTEPHVDDVRNTLIDPLSAGKWDGIWTNAGFGGKCPLGALDDIWARAVVYSQGGKTVAMVSVDVVGWFQEEVDRIRAELAEEHPEVHLDALIVSATHAHEGPDTMGLWHGEIGLDGKYPLYQRFIRDRIIAAIVDAHGARETAWVRFARGTEARGLRDSRPPIVFDTDVWVAEFVRPHDESAIGTLVNWSNHPEALGGSNPMISSDYAHSLRLRMENVRGGTAIFFSGSVGGLMTPLSVNNVPGFPSDDRSYARTLALGEMVADSAIAAIDGAPYASDATVSVAHKDFIIPFENQSLAALNEAGVFDKELVVDGSGQAGVLTEMYAATLGPAVFITVPGELFPEIAGGGFGRTGCPEADTGRPHEPVIRDQFASATFKFLFGLGQDELGYIVPGYDFWGFGVPADDLGFEIPEPIPDPDPRPTIFIGVEERVDPCGESHYEETVSAGSVMAPLVACTAAELAGRDPFGTWETDPEFAACSPENTTTGPGGIELPGL